MGSSGGGTPPRRTRKRFVPPGGPSRSNKTKARTTHAERTAGMTRYEINKLRLEDQRRTRLAAFAAKDREHTAQVARVTRQAQEHERRNHHQRVQAQRHHDLTAPDGVNSARNPDGNPPPATQ